MQKQEVHTLCRTTKTELKNGRWSAGLADARVAFNKLTLVRSGSIVIQASYYRNICSVVPHDYGKSCAARKTAAGPELCSGVARQLLRMLQSHDRYTFRELNADVKGRSQDRKRRGRDAAAIRNSGKMHLSLYGEKFDALFVVGLI